MKCERLASRSIDIGDRTLFERCFSFEALLDFVCEWPLLRLASESQFLVRVLLLPTATETFFFAFLGPCRFTDANRVPPARVGLFNLFPSVAILAHAGAP